MSSATKKPWKKTKIACLTLIAIPVIAVLAFFGLREGEEVPPPELLCYSGAYRLEGGETLILGPSSEGTLRYRLLSGRSGRLYPAGDGLWEAGPYWSGREPVVSTLEMGSCEDRTLRFTHQNAPAALGERVEMRTVPLEFESHGLTLHGRLVIPPGDGPFPTVVLVHGSNRDSALHWNAQQNVFPAQGVAALVFDKRGTGASDGEYTQDFDLLSDDVVAAVAALRGLARPEVGAIGLAGFSQGGWVAPLAATKTPVDFVIAAYGMAESPLAEDRDEALGTLAAAGYGEEELGRAREVLSATGRVMASRFESGWDELAAVKERYGDEPWFEEIQGEFSGDFLRYPAWVVRRIGPYFDVGTSWSYDPLPVLETLEIPHLWIIAGKDLEAPPERTLEILRELTARKANLELVVFDEADHGILVFEEVDGERRFTGHAPGYLELLGRWVRTTTDPAAPAGPEAVSPTPEASAG